VHSASIVDSQELLRSLRFPPKPPLPTDQKFDLIHFYLRSILVAPLVPQLGSPNDCPPLLLLYNNPSQQQI